MKITPAELNEMKRFLRTGLSYLINNMQISNAEVAFEDNNDSECSLEPIITPLGMAILLDYLEKKHRKTSNIFVIDHEANSQQIQNVLAAFDKMPNASKIILIIWSGGHWRTALGERYEDKTHIVVIDSKGIDILSNPVESTINSNSTLKQNTILYRSVNKLQVDKNNCGIIALKVANKFSYEKNFVKKLQDGCFLLTLDKANSHFTNSKQSISTFNVVIDNYFSLPPEYFALAQKKSYLAYYKDEFGDRKGIKEFEHTSRRNQQTLFLDDLFNRKHREESLSKIERDDESHINYNVLYFSNKYIEAALIAIVRDLLNKNLAKTEILATLKLIASKHILDDGAGNVRFLSISEKTISPIEESSSPRPNQG